MNILDTVVENMVKQESGYPRASGMLQTHLRFILEATDKERACQIVQEVLQDEYKALSPVE
jgi:hypothetical protein